jgi:hypothetical protein
LKDRIALFDDVGSEREPNARHLEKFLPERNEASPVIARSRHGTVREYQLHLTGIAKRQTLPHDGDCGLWWFKTSSSGEPWVLSHQNLCRTS